MTDATRSKSPPPKETELFKSAQEYLRAITHWRGWQYFNTTDDDPLRFRKMKAFSRLHEAERRLRDAVQGVKDDVA